MVVQLSSAAFTAAITLFLVRALSTNAYGLFALSLSVGAIATLPSDLGISSSAARFIAEHRGDRAAIADVIASALRLKLAVGATVSVALALLAGPIASAYGEPGMVWPLRAIAIAVFGQSLMLLFSGAFIAQGLTSRSLGLVLSESAAEFGATVTFVLLGGGAVGAALGRATGYCAGAAIGVLVVFRAVGGRPRRSARRRGGTRRIMRYAGPLSAIDWIYTSLHYVDIIIIGALLTATSVAHFEAPMRLIAFVLYPGLALASGVAPRLAAHEREPRSVVPFSTSLRLLLVLYAAVCALLVAWAEPIVVLLFGSDYEESASILRALVPYVFLAGFAPLVSQTANYLGVARQRVPIALGALAVNAGLDFALIPTLGATGAGLATSAGFAVYVPAHLLICKRHLDLPLGRLGWTLARSLTAGAAAAVALALVGTSSLSFVAWVGGGAAALIVFAAVLLLSRELTAADLRLLRAAALRLRPSRTPP
jgi:O-antigen/teichoic acid export membrane protein